MNYLLINFILKNTQVTCNHHFGPRQMNAEPLTTNRKIFSCLSRLLVNN
jgi:hypothetical protein